MLKCKFCKRKFEYSFIVGVAINSIRIWNYRYMECPLCRHWSLFKLSGKNVKRIKF